MNSRVITSRHSGWCCLVRFCLVILTQWAVVWCATSSAETGIHHSDNSCQNEDYNLTVASASYDMMTVHWSMPKAADEEDVQSFEIHYCRSSNKTEDLYKQVSSTARSAKLLDLQYGTNYTLYLIANYTSGHCGLSQETAQMTRGYGPDNPCDCDLRYVATNTTCHPKTGVCTCKSPAKGEKCNECQTGFYFNSTSGCIRCTCNKMYETNDCEADGDKMKCKCKPRLTGPGCTQCVKGYYGSNGACAKCDCHDNHNVTAPVVCDKTGRCVDCQRNTTGKYCEKCLPGYIGDPVHKQDCILEDELNHDSGSNKYMIIIVTVGIVLAVVVIILASYCIYRHWSNFRYKPFNFWTVQLREDHEAVHFSDRMEHHEYRDERAPPATSKDDKDPAPAPDKTPLV